jgi:CheY-like chemotaxis protein
VTEKEKDKIKPVVDRSAPIVNRPKPIADRPAPPKGTSAGHKSATTTRSLAPARPAADRPFMPQVNSGKGRILVVDDERAIADSLAFMLSHEGYKSQAAYSADEAIEIAKDFRPDLVIADVILPGKNGIEACIAILRILPGCKTMLFSGVAMGKELVDAAAKKGHVFNLIEKPLHPQEFIGKVRSVFNS